MQDFAAFDLPYKYLLRLVINSGRVCFPNRARPGYFSASSSVAVFDR
jgi:hypothetical protein